MKIIDRTKQRIKEARYRKELERKELEEKKRAELEGIVPTIKVVFDWRINGEYEKFMENRVQFYGEARKNRNNFLADAISNRKWLKNIIIEEHNPTSFSPCEAELEIDSDLFQELQEEAFGLGLDLDQYIRGIFYTTAYEVNQKRARLESERIKKREEERREWATIHPKDGGEIVISRDLLKKLDKKYGKPKKVLGFTGGMISHVSPENYVSRLIKLAEEHFGLD